MPMDVRENEDLINDARAVARQSLEDTLSGNGSYPIEFRLAHSLGTQKHKVCLANQTSPRSFSWGRTIIHPGKSEG